MALAPQESESTKQPTNIFSLPAELRQQIYSYLLPKPEIFIPVRYARLRWLAASRRLFQDAAPLFYNTTIFSPHLLIKPERGLRESLERHVCLTYGRDAPAWVLKDAMAMLKMFKVHHNSELRDFDQTVPTFAGREKTFSG